MSPHHIMLPSRVATRLLDRLAPLRSETTVRALSEDETRRLIAELQAQARAIAHRANAEDDRYHATRSGRRDLSAQDADVYIGSSAPGWDTAAMSQIGLIEQQIADLRRGGVISTAVTEWVRPAPYRRCTDGALATVLECAVAAGDMSQEDARTLSRRVARLRGRLRRHQRDLRMRLAATATPEARAIDALPVGTAVTVTCDGGYAGRLTGRRRLSDGGTMMWEVRRAEDGSTRYLGAYWLRVDEI